MKSILLRAEGLVSALKSIVPLQGPSRFKRVLFRVLSGTFRSYSKKWKISRNNYSLSLAVTRCISRQSFYKRSIESALIEVYSKTDFSRNSHYKETSNFICITNHLTGFRITQVSTERNFLSELWLQNTLTCNKYPNFKVFN